MTSHTDHFTEARKHAAVLAEYRDAFRAEVFTEQQSMRLVLNVQEDMFASAAMNWFDSGSEGSGSGV